MFRFPDDRFRSRVGGPMLAVLIASCLPGPVWGQDHYCGVYSAYSVLDHYQRKVPFESLLEMKYVSGFQGSLAAGGLFGAWAAARSTRRESELTRLPHPPDEIEPFRHESVGISIIMPVFNEVHTIRQVVEKVLQAASEYGWNWELIIVDDGSTDDTRLRLNEFANHDRIRILNHERNQGKGAAIRTALAVVEREWTVIQDADLEYAPGQIAALLEARFRSNADVVYGSRVLGAESGIAETRWNLHAAGVCVLNAAVRVIYGLKITDEATCHKLFRTEHLRRMELDCEGFEFCPEVTAKSARMGLTLIEIPISYQPRSWREGKKIRWQDGFIAVQTLWRFRNWTPRNG